MTNAFAGSWTALPEPLTPWILDVIHSMGHTQMTPVQASTIPLFMRHKDVVVEAVTGSGKTLAFVIPILEKVLRRRTRLRKNEIGALVISPTRELAAQIHAVFDAFLSSQPVDEHDASDAGSRYPPALLLVSSQSSPAQDTQRFLETGADVVIGTPGRVEEFLLGKGRASVIVKELEVLVLDEADRLLDLGFQASLTRIIAHLPKQRRTGLFSATMTDADAISELVRVGLRNPARIVVKVQAKKSLKSGNKVLGEVIEERRIPANLQNLYLKCRTSEKLVQLTRIITHETSMNAASQFIVYFATCACVDYFYKIFAHLLPPSVSLHSLHGNLPPHARTRTLNSFVSAVSTCASPSILLATDVAARGLDLPHVDVVVQFDPPSDPKAFSHRCGRTARAGRSGRAWVLLVGRESDYVDFMSIRKIPLKEQPYLKDDGHHHQTTDDQEDSSTAVFQRKIREFVLTDRAIHDKSIQAFVSFVRAYSKHEASYIFRLKDLDLVGVAKCFGLLRLPKMPELKGVPREGWEDAKVDWDNFSYADKAREAKRIAAKVATNSAEMEKKREKKRAEREEKKKRNTAWSEYASKKEERQKRRDKRAKKKEWLKTRAIEQFKPSNDSSKRLRVEDDEDTWEELAKEERMAKKLKRGEISQREFDAEFADLT